jgi:hypothetical protein
MAKGLGAAKQQQKIKHKPKRTSASGNPSMVKRSAMSKDQKRSYKKYRGQGGR